MKKKLPARLCLAALILAALPAPSLRAAKYPPGIRWREIGREGITVIFPAERSAEAAAALASARALAIGLASFWGIRPPGRTRIVLGDFTDQANGFATFFPYNLVGIDLAEPPPDSEIAGSGPWLDRVLAHELTHVFNLNAGSPPFRLARRMFGTNPVFFPAAQLPPWVIEGLAIQGESRLTGNGRLNRAPYRLMLDAARREGVFPGWRSLAGMPAAWPGGAAKYLFGACFMEFLAEKYGADAPRRYLERFSSRLLTLGASRDFRKLFGKPLGELWREYREGRGAPRRPAIEPLTKDGFANRYPCALDNGRLAYYHRDFRGRGQVRLIDRTGDERVLFKMDAVNALAAGEDGMLYLSAAELRRSFRDFSDLYAYDLKKGRLQRLSKGKRLSHPARQPARPAAPERIYCVERRNNRSRLALFDPKKGEAHSISPAFAGMAHVSLSADGARIAAAAKTVDGRWGIAVFQSSGAVESFLSQEGFDLSQPRWRQDGKLLFIATSRKTSFLACWSPEIEGAWRLDEPRLDGIRQFDLSSDGMNILFAYHRGRGEELARIPSKWIPQTPIEISVATGLPEGRAVSAAPIASRPYRPLRDLLPRWWSPALRSGGDEVQAGLATGGQDALGIHSYSMEAYYGTESRRGSFLFQYAFDGLYPTLWLVLGDSVEYYRGSDTASRTRELTLASLWPLRLRRRSQLHAYADLHLEKRLFIFPRSEFAPGDMMNGVRLGMRFNTARAWYDSISPADGITLTAQAAFHPAGLGNELASRALQADMRAYLPFFRPGVLALRLAAAKNWEPASLYYDMGGVMADGGLGGSRPLRLLRGFATGRFLGNRGWQLNAECRLPLFRIEKAILPAVSLDRLWLAVFFDAGRLASRSYVPPIARSLGAEAVLRLGIGGLAAYDIAIGAAHGSGPERGWQIYLRSGRSF